jgi:hypothetical protein
MVTRKGPWRRCGMAASLAVFCCVALTSGDASATVEWGRVGEVTTLTSGQLCKNDGKYIICDSTTPTISSGNVGIGSTTPGATLTLTGTEALNLGSDYTTTGLQSDVAINTASAFRYNGAGTATFYGIVAGVVRF